MDTGGGVDDESSVVGLLRPRQANRMEYVCKSYGVENESCYSLQHTSIVIKTESENEPVELSVH